MYVIGTIKRSEIETFKVECDKLGWLFMGEKDGHIIYLDRRMNEHKLKLADETALMAV